jgi:hypothetical protein
VGIHVNEYIISIGFVFAFWIYKYIVGVPVSF